MRALMGRPQLAERLGVSEESIRRWERGGSRPSPEHLVRLIAVLAIDGAVYGARPASADELPTLARRLVDERSQRGVTQVEAAQILGVAQATYAGWEIGRATPAGPALPGIAEYLGLDVREVEDLVAVPFVVDSTHWPPLGQLMGARRAALRQTRQELARFLGVAVSTVVAWELGYRIPRAQQVRALAAALEVSPTEVAAALPVGTQLSALGNLVRSRQVQLGLRLGDIAARAEVDESTLSRWLHGRRAPALASLRRLADALELPFPLVREVAGLAF